MACESVLGQVLTIPQRLALSASLEKLKTLENAPRSALWGRIQGLERDYIVAYTYALGERFELQFYFSADNAVSFSKLPELDAFIAEKAPNVRGRFRGVPGHKYREAKKSKKVMNENGEIVAPEEAEEEPEQEEEEEQEAPEEEQAQDSAPKPVDPSKRKLTELERLSWVVRTITTQTFVLPKGYFVLTPTRNIMRNEGFKGLSAAEARELSSYLLWRNEVSARTQYKVRKQGIANCADFLDSPVDEPSQAAWTLHVDESGLQVTIRNLEWPGYEMRLKANAPEGWVSAYFGTGERNEDLAFML